MPIDCCEIASWVIFLDVGHNQIQAKKLLIIRLSGYQIFALIQLSNYQILFTALESNLWLQVTTSNLAICQDVVIDKCPYKIHF